MEFIEFDKIARLSRQCVVTEKIDGTNASIVITDAGDFFTGSRTRWITPDDDNYGFAKWAQANKEDLLKLGPGSHYGEWWGLGIQRNYGLKEKRFSLFNTARWSDDSLRPSCCSVVPVLYNGVFDTEQIFLALQDLRINGSKAASGFMKPEGVVIWHEAARIYFKKTIEKDESPKSKQDSI
jgi:RNA ligase